MPGFRIFPLGRFAGVHAAIGGQAVRPAQRIPDAIRRGRARLAEQWEDENPEILDMLLQQGYVEKDAEGKYRITPQGTPPRREQGAGRTVRRPPQRHARPARDRLPRHAERSGTMRPSRMNTATLWRISTLQETLRNALHRQGHGTPIRVTEDDFAIYESEYPDIVRHGGAAGHVGQHEPVREIRRGEESRAGDAIPGPRKIPGRLSAGRRVLHVRLAAERTGIAAVGPEAGEHLRSARPAADQSRSSAAIRAAAFHEHPRRAAVRPADSAAARVRRTSRSSRSPTANRRPTSKAATCC